MLLNDVRAQVLSMLAEGDGPSAIAKEVGIARTSVYRIKKEAAEGRVKHPPRVIRLYRGRTPTRSWTFTS
jgi:DNA invertase Pin-like site-specific DNA recombinase